MGDQQFIVRVNNMAPSIASLNRLPINKSAARLSISPT